jgi:hypothetical protein
VHVQMKKLLLLAFSFILLSGAGSFMNYSSEEELPPPNNVDTYASEEELPPPNSHDAVASEEELPPPNSHDAVASEEELPPPNSYEAVATTGGKVTNVTWA